MIKIAFYCVFMLSILFSNAQGIEFDTTIYSWEQALSIAQTKDKIIFVDVYTSWCVPCKIMDKTVFKRSDIGDFYNKNFISLKINAEVENGLGFARTNRVTAYPTFLYFSPKGEMILAGVGSKSTESFLKMGVDAIQNLKDGLSLLDLQKKISSGNANSDYLIKYVKKLSSLQAPNSIIIEEYLKLIPRDSLYTSNTTQLVSTGYFGRMPTDGIAFNVLMDAYKKYPIKSFELLSPWNTIRSRLMEYVDSAGSRKDTLWLYEILDANNQLDVENVANRERQYFLCKYYAASKDSSNLIKAAQEFANRFLININYDSLYKSDLDQLDNSLTIKFKTNNKNDLERNSTYETFLKGYFSETRILVNEIHDIINISRRIIQNPLWQQKFREWFKVSIELYRNNPVYINSFILKRMQDNYLKISDTN